MSIIDTLITDRTPADAALVRSLNATGWAAMTDEQRALYLSEGLKGAYKASDLNRVNAAMDYLVGRLKAQGINVPIKRSKIPHNASGGKRLPKGHTELKWIESTGTQYVDTLFKPNQDSRVIVDVELNEQSTYPRTLFGGRDSTTSVVNSFVFWAISANGFRTDFGTQRTSISVVPVGRFVVDKNKAVTSVNGAEYTTTATTFQSNSNLALFTAIGAGKIDDRMMAGKLYASQIYDNDALVRDYVPDMLDSGEVGLYDMVEGKFYPNAGTGVFLAGDVVDTGPSVEYDDYTWYDSDVPTSALLVEHLSNVSSVRSALRAALPEIPADMDDGLTIAEANNIELVLVNVEQLINNMLSAWVYCAEIYSGEV